MKADKYRFDGDKKCRLQDLPTNAKKDGVDKEEILQKFRSNMDKIIEMQNVFYADKREGIVVVLQAQDAAGKDSLIRHVAGELNPQGVKVACFKRPNDEELAHDYLWRVNKALPERGEIVILNRSYYEDVITAKVHKLKDTYHMAQRVTGVSEEEFIDRRIRQVKNYEQYLYENSYRVVKVFLHVSKDEQRERFLERIDRQDKNWKFESSDLEDRKLFSTFIDTFNDVITKTATRESPWYAIPADNKWYTRYLFSEILLNVIESTHPQYPQLPEEEQKKLAACKAELLAEENTPKAMIVDELEKPVSGDPKKWEKEEAEDKKEEKKAEKKEGKKADKKGKEK